MQSDFQWRIKSVLRGYNILSVRKLTQASLSSLTVVSFWYCKLGVYVDAYLCMNACVDGMLVSICMHSTGVRVTWAIMHVFMSLCASVCVCACTA